MSSEDLLTIRQMCDEFNVTARTLRFYEAKELLFPKRQGQKRLFAKRDRARMKLILRGKRFGFSLEEIRQLLEMYRPGAAQKPQLKKAYQVALEHLCDLEQKRADLDTTIADLRDQIKWGECLLKSMTPVSHSH
jgi:DNA-binding transcriptional MerR regulator